MVRNARWLCNHNNRPAAVAAEVRKHKRMCFCHCFNKFLTTIKFVRRMENPNAQQVMGPQASYLIAKNTSFNGAGNFATWQHQVQNSYAFQTGQILWIPKVYLCLNN